MAHKGATQQQNSGRRQGDANPKSTRAQGPTARSPALERALWITIGLSVVVALVQLYIHAQLHATRGSYTSFCNVSSTVNCDAVLASPFGTLLGVPVAAWGLASYLLIAALLFRRGRTVGATRNQTSLLLLGIALWNVVFAVYMAGVATVAIGVLCLLCAAAYLTIAVTGVLAWRLAQADLGVSGQSIVSARRVAVAGAAMVLGVGVAAAAQFVNRPFSGATMTAADVKAHNPEFYDWYTTRPIAKDLPPAVHGKGPTAAPVTIIEFSDFECPACAMAFHDLHDLTSKNPDLVRLVFHHFPLDSDCNPNVQTRMHRFACQAAIASECAERAGKFWEYHDLLFTSQDKLGRDDLVAKAVGLGIPKDTFIACLDDPSVRARVLSDTAAGAKLGVKSTPTLVINGRAVEGALERSAYEYVIALERRS